MEALVKPVLTVKYELARQILLNLLQKGLISKVEFEAIDSQNRKSFCN